MPLPFLARIGRVVAVLAACLLAACGNVQHGGKVHVEFWTMSLKPKFIGYFQSRIAHYQATHPNVELEWVDVPWDALQTKLTAAIVAGCTRKS